MPYKQNDDFDSFEGYNTNTGFSEDEFGADPFADGFYGSLGGYSPESDTANDYSVETGKSQESFLQNEDTPPVNSLTYESVKNIATKTKETIPIPPYKVTKADYDIQKKSRIMSLIFLFVFMCIAILMIVFGININNKNDKAVQDYKDNGETVIGRIVNVDYETTNKSFYLVARIRYNYNNSELYTTKKFKDDTSKKVGDSVKLVVLPSDPSNPRLESSLVSSDNMLSIIIFIIMGVVFSLPFIISFIIFIRFLKDPYNVKYYKKESSRYYALQRQRRSGTQGSVWKTDFGSVGKENPSDMDSELYTGYETTDNSSYKKPNVHKIKTDPLSGLKLARAMLILGIIWMLIFAVPVAVIAIHQKQDEEFFDRAEAKYATVTHISAVKSTSSTGSRKTKTTRSKSTHYDYYATVEYQVGDTLYRRGEFLVDADTTNTKKVLVYIDPDNPGDCRVKDIKNSRTWYIFVLCSIGAVGLIDTFISLYAYRSQKKKLML